MYHMEFSILDVFKLSGIPIRGLVHMGNHLYSNSSSMITAILQLGSTSWFLGSYLLHFEDVSTMSEPCLDRPLGSSTPTPSRLWQWDFDDLHLWPLHAWGLFEASLSMRFPAPNTTCPGDVRSINTANLHIWSQTLHPLSQKKPWLEYINHATKKNTSSGSKTESLSSYASCNVAPLICAMAAPYCGSSQNFSTKTATSRPVQWRHAMLTGFSGSPKMAKETGRNKNDLPLSIQKECTTRWCKSRYWFTYDIQLEHDKNIREIEKRVLGVKYLQDGERGTCANEITLWQAACAVLGSPNWGCWQWLLQTFVRPVV